MYPRAQLALRSGLEASSFETPVTTHVKARLDLLKRSRERGPDGWAYESFTDS